MQIRDTDESQYSIVPANESQASLIPLVRSRSRLRISAAVSCTRTMMRKASMTTLVESGSTLKLSVAIREYEDNEEKRKSSAQLDLTAPPKEEVEEPVAVASAHLCTQKLPHPLSVNEFMPIRDTDERQYAIIPANKSQASMIALVVEVSD
ncbi:hypothetical protein J6590_082122 [Homalodisca vitripennis]|nr:hypothetical protein J6590_082122 [Homalodisca vitripennis]